MKTEKHLLLVADQPDEELMEGVRSGEEAALGLLVERHWKTLVKYAWRFESDVDSSEDLVQEAFVRLWQNRAGWVLRGTVKSYLYRIVRNLALQEQEKRQVRMRWRDRISATLAGAPSPAEHLAAKTLQGKLEAALQSLPPRRREILVLARFHGLSYREIGEVMGISVQTVANQMSAALKHLRKEIPTDG